MPEPTIHDIDDYERYLHAALADLSPAQRTAFCAAMAERYLPVYAAFSKAEDWGDPAQMRRSLDAVWEHLGGKALSAREVDRHLGLVRDGTPHMDDFDEEETALPALATAMMVAEALESCRSKDNLTPAVQSAMSGFEAVLPGWSDDPREQPRLWQKSAARREYSQQMWLLERARGITLFHRSAVQALRREAAGKEHAGKVPRPKAPAGPARLTNQALFEQYQRVIELDIKTGDQGWQRVEMTPTLEAMRLLSHWMGRYSRRKQIFDGVYGAWADTTAQSALAARNKAVDASVPGRPAWDADIAMIIEMTFSNPYNGLGLKALDEPHGCGPSLRRLWLEAKQRGLSDAEASAAVAAWGKHRPPAWEAEDRRKKKGQAIADPALGEMLAQRVRWENTGEPLLPWSAQVEGKRWQARINDFPDDYMYTLIVNGEEFGSFHDWPETWERE